MRSALLANRRLRPQVEVQRHQIFRRHIAVVPIGKRGVVVQTRLGVDARRHRLGKVSETPVAERCRGIQGLGLFAESS